ncbi:hypothetical protein Tco_0452708 [Tanacetum coccineum]
MLAPGNYVQWKSRIKRYIDTKHNNKLILYCLQNPPYTFKWAERTILIKEGSSKTTIEGIDNDIYSIFDACPNTCEMWKVIERDSETLESYYSRFYKMINKLARNKCDVTSHQVNVQFLLQLQLEWQRFVTLVKQSQELKTVSYHKLYDILKQHQNEVNKIRAERLAYLTARETQTICVKVDRLWKQNVYGKPLGIKNMECILIDKENIKEKQNTRIIEKKSIQNGYFGTRLFINSGLPEIKDFYHKLMLENAETKTTSMISLSKGTFNSTHDEFLNQALKRFVK